MKSPGRAHIRYSPYTRFHCTFYCFPPRMIQIEKFLVTDSKPVKSIFRKLTVTGNQ